jgi:hypothetical protein
MIRIGLLGAFVLAAAGACSKADPRPTDTAPPAATRGDGTKGGPGAAGGGGGGGGGVEIQVAGGGGDTEGGAAKANDTSYALTTEQAAPTTAGGETVARLVVKPGAGYKMNKEFPTKLTLEPPAGVTLAKPVMVLEDAEKFSEQELTFAVKMSAPAAGEFTIPGTFKFAVCTDTTCDPKKQKVALVLKAN